MKAALSIICLLQLAIIFWFSRIPQPQTISAPRFVSVSKEIRVPVVITKTNIFDWRSVESPDYKAYIANLRLIGCPEETIRDIITADVDKLFAAREGNQTNQLLNFWEYKSSRHQVLHLANWKRDTAIKKQKRAFLSELLGIDFETEIEGGPYSSVAKRLAFLAPETRRQVLDLYIQYTDLSNQIYTERVANGEPLSKEDSLERKRLKKELVSKIQEILRPEEFEVYQFWMSETGDHARRFLAPIKPTEQEFRHYFALMYSAYEMLNEIELPTNEAGNIESTDRFQELSLQRQQAEENFKNFIGETRYAAIIKGIDDDYKNAQAISSRYGLPPGTADKVYELKGMWKSASKAQRDRTTPVLEAEKKRIAQELRQVLGSEVFTNYTKRGYLNWLK